MGGSTITIAGDLERRPFLYAAYQRFTVNPPSTISGTPET
jgi:hypothetical protein